MKPGRYLWLPCLGALFLSACEQEKKELPPQKTGKVEIPDFSDDAGAFSGANAYNRVARFVALGPRPAGSPAFEESIRFLEEELARFGWKTERQAFTKKTPVGEKNFVNLRARCGADADFKKSPQGVIGCHSDTKVFDFSFVAANDGASHMAVLLEFARLMGKSPERWEGVELVFFDGEEAFGKYLEPEVDGLYGSSHYVESLGGKLPRWMVNLDMLGARMLRIAIPVDTPQEMYALYRKTLLERQESEDVFYVSDSIVWDDHFPFQQAGVPVLNFIADFREGGWWHTPKDNLELISAASLERSGKFIWAFLQNLSVEPSFEGN